MNEKEFEYNGIKLKAIPLNELRKDETNVIFVEVKDENME